MIWTLSAVRITCDCSNDGATDVCAAQVVGYGFLPGDARSDAVTLAYHEGWTLRTVPGTSGVAYAPGHMVQTSPGVWVRPVCLVKSYA